MSDATATKNINFTEVAKKAAAAVTKDGWVRYSMGASQGINYNSRFDLYIRRRNLAELAAKNDVLKINTSKQQDFKNAETPHKIGVFDDFSGMVSKAPMGMHRCDLTPSRFLSVVRGGRTLPVLSDLSEYPSLAAVRSDKPVLVIAYDSEWYYLLDNGVIYRTIISWQFSLIAEDELVEYVILRKSEKCGLSLELALGRILDSLGLDSVDIRCVRKFESITGTVKETGKPVTTLHNSRAEAAEASVRPFSDGKPVHTVYDWSAVDHIPIVLVCHAGKGDVSGFDQRAYYAKNILKYCTEVQGGLITLRPTMTYAQSVNPEFAKNHNTHTYPVSLQLADTMCHAPAGMKSLKDLGKTVGWEKVELNEGMIEHMDQLISSDPCLFFEYAANDSTVALLYESALYGYNNKPPVTITSATAKTMKKVMMAHLGCKTTKEFDRKYRGLERVGHGLTPREDRPGYIESSSLEPISDKANTIQHYASHAYNGGYNASSDIGYFPGLTCDYDLRNAYPTAMCLVPDIDWENPILAEIINRDLSLGDFIAPIASHSGYHPLVLMLAYVTFEFPADVKYPCIPVKVDGIPVYPLSSDGFDGVYVCGSDLYLALKLGAKVHAERCYILNTIHNPDNGMASYSLRAAMKQLVADRSRATIEHGKKSLEELTLKTMASSGYGKNAQNVIQKASWVAYNNAMKNIGCSGITNPFSACMTTSIVRSVLLAAQNQCHALGYMACSVTTDGFISDIPENILRGLDLFGFRAVMEQSRFFLTDGEDTELWEMKHCQDDLVNFTTRGNVSLRCWDNPMIYEGKEYEGVCAHNSTKSGYKSDSYDDRLWLMTQVLGRTGTVDYTSSEWTEFKELVKGADFSVRETIKHIRMDFDMKRKPDRNSFSESAVDVGGRVYKIANFTTVPFHDAAEFLEYRQRKSNMDCLRTMEDWDMFWFKSDVKDKGSNAKVRDSDWAVLNSCIMGHRAGLWVIPKLDELQGVERDAWINAHNTSSKKWKSTDWKNAGRAARQVNILPREMLEDMLLELMAE